MSEISHVIRLVAALANASNRSPHTVSRWASGDGMLYKRLIGGADITSRRHARMIQWFSDHWPPDLEWPADIPRPDPAPDSPAVQTVTAAVADPVAAVEAALDRVDAAMLRSDWSGVERENGIALRAALTLRPDGRLASPKALCRFLHARRYTYDEVVRQYADGHPRANREPRAGTLSARMLAALVAAGDARFTSRFQGNAA